MLRASLTCFAPMHVKLQKIIVMFCWSSFNFYSTIVQNMRINIYINIKIRKKQNSHLIKTIKLIIIYCTFYIKIYRETQVWKIFDNVNLRDWLFWQQSTWKEWPVFLISKQQFLSYFIFNGLCCWRSGLNTASLVTILIGDWCFPAAFVKWSAHVWGP